MSIKDDDPCLESKCHYAGQKRARNPNAVEYMIAKSKRKKSS